MDWTLLTLVLVFIIIGSGWRRFDDWMDHRRAVQRHRLGMLPDPGKPVCGCKHHLAFHDHITGRCNGPAQQAVDWVWDDENEVKVPVRWTSVPCPCQQYTGPSPVAALRTPLVPAPIVAAPGNEPAREPVSKPDKDPGLEEEVPATVSLDKAPGDPA
ncbi:hypothetical protein [Actinomadura violacea]|uniref:Uncharacterized protein n=1 Tax=Actinomadura violacea TaxID=2819934 RepID=A0ABS3RXZ7_9ACTN|nr:hypothetical protein [Actinomadura violacea]MBO2461639.1 hypothetical protein [Actinomadura violacea]